MRSYNDIIPIEIIYISKDNWEELSKIPYGIAVSGSLVLLWIVSQPLVHEIAPHYITTTPQETGLTAPPNERHIPVYAQEPSPLSRQKHAQQAYTSHATTYQYLNSSVMPNQECPQPHITFTPGQIPYLHQTQQQPLPSAI